MVNTKIVAHTKWSKGGRGEYPARYVVLKWSRAESAHEYSRHMQVNDGKHKDYYIYGHYFHTFKDALDDLTKSLKSDLKNYSPKSPSYIAPGVTILAS